MKIILFMLMIRKVIGIIKKTVKSHQNIENLKFIKSAFKIPNALNHIMVVLVNGHNKLIQIQDFGLQLLVLVMEQN